jgi:hypothetical protein
MPYPDKGRHRGVEAFQMGQAAKPQLFWFGWFGVLRFRTATTTSVYLGLNLTL